MTIEAMMLLAPCAKMLAVAAIARVGWLVLGDVVLEHVGIPFLDAGWRRYDRVRRRTGMSRDVRAW